MSKTVKPVTSFQISGAHAKTIAMIGAPKHLVLIALVGEDAYHVVRQHTDGKLEHQLGPFGANEALDAAQRVLSGREHSVTGDSLTAVAGLVAIAAGGGAL